MERSGKREERRTAQYRTRGGRAGGQRSERTQPENTENSTKNERPPRQNQERPRRERLPNIRLERDEKDIKLNDEQAAIVKEFDEKIRAIGKIEIPEIDVLNVKLEEFEKEINTLNGKSQALYAKLDSIQARQDSYTKTNNPHKGESDSAFQRITEINKELEPIEAQLKAVKDRRAELQTRKTNLKEKFNARNVGDVDYQIETIEYEIETQTLSNAQLKAKLAKIDALKKSRSQYAGISELDKNISLSAEQEDKLWKQRKALMDERSKLYDKRKQFYEENKEVRAAIDKFRKERDEVYQQIKVIKAQIRDQIKERNDFRSKFYDQREKMFDKRRERAELENKRRQVFQEAERRMNVLEKGAKQAGEIKERRNPHEAEISAGRSLITFLQSIIDKEEEAKEAAQSKEAGKLVSSAANDLVASLRKKSKKDKKMEKKERKIENHPVNTKLVLPIMTIQQFATVGVTAPSTTEQIADTLVELKKRVNAWAAEFVKLVLDFNIQPDGTIKSSIRLAWVKAYTYLF